MTEQSQAQESAIYIKQTISQHIKYKTKYDILKSEDENICSLSSTVVCTEVNILLKLFELLGSQRCKL